MGIIEIGDPMKWSWWKKLACLMVLLLIIGVFLTWGKTEVLVGDTVNTATSHNGMDWTEGWSLVFTGLFAGFFLITGYTIYVNKDGEELRINELLTGMLAFIAFINAAKVYSTHKESAGEVIQGSVTVTTSIGVGVYLILAASFLLMVFSYLLWKEMSNPKPVEAVAEEDIVEEKAVAER